MTQIENNFFYEDKSNYALNHWYIIAKKNEITLTNYIFTSGITNPKSKKWYKQIEIITDEQLLKTLLKATGSVSTNFDQKQPLVKGTYIFKHYQPYKHWQHLKISKLHFTTFNYIAWLGLEITNIHFFIACLFCLFIGFFPSLWRIFYLYWDLPHGRKGFKFRRMPGSSGHRAVRVFGVVICCDSTDISSGVIFFRGHVTSAPVVEHLTLEETLYLF